MRRLEGFGGQALRRTTLGVSLASALSGLAGVLLLWWVTPSLPQAPFWRDFLQVAGLGGVCAALYLLITDRLGITRWRALFAWVRERL
ncbi:MAG: hypothetical protein HC915_15400 [Anaerolineae bacterium]|nr:hypothetical protein [Anaerolineae bacterium]